MYVTEAQRAQRVTAGFLLLALVMVLGFGGTVFAKHLHLEKYYQDLWCAERGGRVEVVMPDRTRCDCLTEEMAVEVDFASKWYEGISQALHYAMLSGKKAGLLLIVEKPGDWKYVERARRLIEFYELPVRVFVIRQVFGF